MGIHRLPRLFARLVLQPALVSALAIVAGCSSASSRSESSLPHYGAKTISDAAAPAGTYQPVERVVADVLTTSLAYGPNQPVHVKTAAPAATKPLNVLVLSGGGQYAAYAGGILVGWTASGTRPPFDVVTGVSSGAFLAVYAYLGPKYDPNIRKLTVMLKTSEVFAFRPLFYWLYHGSIGSSAPLQQLIETEINDECLADIRAAHHSGRRLFVGTMNLRTRRLVIWDLGAIACSSRPDADQLVRKILLASSSIPGVVPSVDIDIEVNGTHYHEEHVDGGAVSQGFVRFGPEVAQPDPARLDTKWLAGSNLYAIAGGKLYPDTVEGDIGMLSRITSTVSGTLYALYRADLWRLYSLCAVSGMKFHHAAVPEETKVTSRSTSFDRATMEELFKLGYDLSIHGGAWRQTPPGYDAGEEEIPRAGFRFTVP
jgi:hypothetical protein